MAKANQFTTHTLRQKAHDHALDIICTLKSISIHVCYEFIIQSLYSKYLLLPLLLTVLQVDALLHFGYIVTNL